MKGTHVGNAHGPIDIVVEGVRFVRRFCGEFNKIGCFRGGNFVAGGAPRTEGWKMMQERWKRREERRTRFFETGKLE